MNLINIFVHVFQLQVNNNQGGIRTHRSSNAAPINIKDVFDVNGGPNSSIYGQSVVGHVNQAYEPSVEDIERNSLRMSPRNHQASWSGNK